MTTATPAPLFKEWHLTPELESQILSGPPVDKVFDWAEFCELNPSEPECRIYDV